ncbi:unnamed protein product [Tetraodon nigroviridis]|uniref:(spotted green pufferfish) hypothetical protein n=1 Tax=Tetraodon nigroviridis TaxID=99883 RepID=Q4S9B6_TETNG|nr:unnamed protein product [Tetraodon nigroviridis]
MAGVFVAAALLALLSAGSYVPRILLRRRLQPQGGAEAVRAGRHRPERDPPHLRQRRRQKLPVLHRVSHWLLWRVVPHHVLPGGLPHLLPDPRGAPPGSVRR